MTVTDLAGTGCSATLANAFLLTPSNFTCRDDNSIPPTFLCSDGIDNDSDGFIDHVSVNPVGGANGDPDPQCSSATDNSEST